MDLTVAYIAEGRLFLREPGKAPAEVECRFVQQALDRGQQVRQRQGWRDRNAVWNPMGVNAPMLPSQFMQPMDTGQGHQFRICGVTGAGPGQLIYTLQSPTIGGLFHYDAGEDDERRLVHRPEFTAQDLARHHGESGRNRIACSVHYPDGSVNLGIMEADGRKLRDITEGDSVDEAPTWVEGDREVLVFQSAGIARDAQGTRTALGPYRIEQLDLEKEKLTTLVEDERFDCLLPRLQADGTLYFVRRPYNPQGHERLQPMLVAKDMLLFPFRLGRAVFHFLNAFSMFFSGKPLTTAGGPRLRGPQERQLMLYGRLIQVRRSEQFRRAHPDGALVPRDWQLIRRSPDGQETVITENALAYDLVADGSIIFTNGSRIWHADGGGSGKRQLCTGSYIEKLVVVR